MKIFKSREEARAACAAFEEALAFLEKSHGVTYQCDGYDNEPQAMAKFINQSGVENWHLHHYDID